MENNIPAVKEEESATSTQPQQTEGQEAQVAAEENVQQDATPQEQVSVQSDNVDENGVPYKNRYMEAQRKLAELSDRLPQIIEETLAKKQAPQEKEYTIQELEEVALQNPNLRPQVEAKKLEIQKREFAQLIEERENKLVASQRAERVRYESEQNVVNDPVFKDCFTKDAMGRKQWNTGHPLSRIIGELLQNPEINSRPDGIRVAADIAYGRYAREMATKATSKAKVLEANLKKEQKKTMVEGGGSISNGSVDEYAKAKEELSKTGSNKAAQVAVSAYLKKIGRLR